MALEPSAEALGHLEKSIILNGFEGLITPLRAAASAHDGWLDLKSITKGCPLGFNTAQAKSVEGGKRGDGEGKGGEGSEWGRGEAGRGGGVPSVRLDTVVRMEAMCGGMVGLEMGGTAEEGERQGDGEGEGGKRLAVAVTAATVVAPAVECEVFMLKIDTDGAEAAVLAAASISQYNVTL